MGYDKQKLDRVDYEPNPKTLVLICLFSPFVIYGSYARGAPVDELILFWGIFVTSFFGIFLYREKSLS
jgi:hypothetical protein